MFLVRYEVLTVMPLKNLLGYDCHRASSSEPSEGIMVLQKIESYTHIDTVSLSQEDLNLQEVSNCRDFRS